MIKSHSTSSLALIASVALPVLSWAGTVEKTKASAPKAAPTPVEKINASAITGDIGVSIYTVMYSRGQILFNQTPTLLPYLDLAGVLYEGDGFLNKAVLGLNVTEYFGHPKTHAAGSPSNEHWYENDFIPSIALSFGKVTITEGFHMYTAPNNPAIGTFEGLNSSISFDDGDLLGAFALHPSFTYMQRTNSAGQYFEGAVAPGVTFGDLALTLPLTVGFGEKGFYGNAPGQAPKNGFAFFSAGLNAAYTLPVSKTYGVWKLVAGVTYYSKDTKVTEQASFVVGGNPQTLKNDDVSANVGIVINF